jgi:hypothetical protein
VWFPIPAFGFAVSINLGYPNAQRFLWYDTGVLLDCFDSLFDV